MGRLDIKRIVKSTLERVKQSEHVRDSDPSIQHLEENVVRSIAELELARLERTTPEAEPLAKPESSEKRDRRLRNAA